MEEKHRTNNNYVPKMNKEEFKNATITVIFLDLCLRKIRSGKSHGFRDYIVFEKFLFLIVFRPIRKSKCRRFQIYTVWRAFSWRISVDGRSDRRNKAAFLDFSGEVWKLPTMNFADFASFEILVGDLSLTLLVFVRFFLQWVKLW